MEWQWSLNSSTRIFATARDLIIKKHMQYSYAPVVKIITFRIMLAIATQFICTFIRWMSRRHFSTEIIQESTRGNLVCELNKLLYGLKQASRIWNKRFHRFVIKLGFMRSKHDYCLYVQYTRILVNENKQIIVHILVYVDDVIIIGNDLEAIQNIKLYLSSEFEIKDIYGYTEIFFGYFNWVRYAYWHTGHSSGSIFEVTRFGLMNCIGISICVTSNRRYQLNWLTGEIGVLRLGCTVLQMQNADFANNRSDRKSISGYVFK